MPDRLPATALWGRALVVGLLTTGLGIVGHVSADGLLPGAPVLLALVVGAVVLSVPVLVREASRLRLVTLAVGGQTVTHLVLAVTAGHRGDLPSSPAPAARIPTSGPSLPTVDGRRVGSLQDAYQLGDPSGAGDSGLAVPAHLVQDLSDHAPMMAAHLVVAVLVGLWLAHGERLAWDLARTTAGHLLALVAPYVAPAVPVAPPVRGAWLGHEPAPRAGWSRALSRRGPPVVAVA